MITYTVLKNAVIGNLQIGSTATDVARYQIDEGLNAAQRFLVNVLPSHMISETVKTVRGDLTVDIARYQWPSDFVRFLRLWLSYASPITDLNPGRPARTMEDVRQVSIIDEMPTTIYPVIDLKVEGGFEIRPIPTASMAKGYRLQYIQYMLEISSTQDCLLRSNLKNLVVNYATHYCAMVEGSFPEIGNAAKERFNNEIEMYLPKNEFGQARI